MMKPDYWGYGTEKLPGCSIPIYHTSKFLKGMHIIDADLCVDFMASRRLRRDHRRMAEGVITTKSFLAGTFDEIDIYDTTHDHLFYYWSSGSRLFADKDWCSKNPRKARQIKMLIMDCFEEES